MTIAIDARAYSWTGIGTYTKNILQALAQGPGENSYIALIARSDEDSFCREVLALDKSGKMSYQVVDGSYYSWREQIIFWRQLLSVRADLFHFTHFNVPRLFAKKYVVTIHDVTRFIFPGQAKQSLRQQIAYEYILAQAAERAAAIITVSNFTKQALQELPINITAPIKTIYEGVDKIFLDPISQIQRQKARLLIGTNNPYLLYVGVWMSHKNLERLLLAFQKVSVVEDKLKLIVTGKPRPGYSNVMSMVRQLSLTEKVVFAGYVPRSLLPALYKEAFALAFPSLYEGFGLPAIEAAAVGTPVIAANVGSLPEVLGPAAAYVNPEDMDGIASTITRLLREEAWRAHIIEQGRLRAKLYRWEDAVKSHKAIYENMLH